MVADLPHSHQKRRSYRRIEEDEHTGTMKFGRNLERNQVPEWKTSYIRYKALKKLIKSAAEDAKHTEKVDTAGTWSVLCFLKQVLTASRILLLPGPQSRGR